MCTDSCGYIARLLLNMICTFQVCKIGTLMELFWEQLCVASMLSGLDAASRGNLIDVDFNELILKGNVADWT